MAKESLSRVTVYKPNIATNADLTLKKYDQVAHATKTVKGKSYEYWLHFLRSKAHPAEWFSAFKDLTSLTLWKGKKPLTQVAGFVLLVKLDNEFYAITGGIGHIALRRK